MLPIRPIRWKLCRTVPRVIGLALFLPLLASVTATVSNFYGAVVLALLLGLFLLGLLVGYFVGR